MDNKTPEDSITISDIESIIRDCENRRHKEKIKGVRFAPFYDKGIRRTKLYYAQGNYKARKYYIGRFNTQQEAKEAVDEFYRNPEEWIKKHASK